MLAPLTSGNDSSPGSDVGTINSLVLEPRWLSSVACGYQPAPTLVPYFAKAQTQSAEFYLYTIHGINLLYHCHKPGILQLVIPNKLGLC